MHSRFSKVCSARSPGGPVRAGMTALLVFAAFLSRPVPVRADEISVAVNDDYFAPAALDVQVGDVVVWINQGNHDHTSTSGAGCTGDGQWDSGTIPAGGTYSMTFNQAGSFAYYCADFCENGMTGLVTVHQASDLACTAGAIPGSGEAQLLVDFASAVTGGVAPYAYAWTFGDGGTDSGAAVHYTYAQPGEYTWTLTVTDFRGDVCTESGNVRLKIPSP